MTVVLDTSALLRLFIPDGPVPAGLEETMRAAERGEATALAPELLLAESANVLLRKWRSRLLARDEYDDLSAAIQRVPLRLVSIRDLIADARQLAVAENITIYDALFLALALRHSARLITADDQLAKIAQRLGC